jgi:hypothetical protein
MSDPTYRPDERHRPRGQMRIIDKKITPAWYEDIQILLDAVKTTHEIQEFKPIRIKPPQPKLQPESARTS